MLSIRGARRSHGAQTLFTDLDLDLPAGHCAAIIGPNGCGKSTLLRCVIDDDRLDAGTIDIAGMRPDERSPRFRELVSADTGEQAAFFDVTLTEHLELLARAHRLEDADVENALADAGLADLADRFPHTLSSGQQQRFALAAALLRPASLLVLDEPERALDLAGQEWVAERIVEAKNDGKAVLVATHSPTLVQRCADDVVDLGR
ncbi:ATP-binding cassette domain-containing protein [Gordonia sp. VNK1]|jgi:ABC-type multidrug transport system ATPase subunit|uniref:ABC transporter ATP-binding protein n=1 Tax=Gordonia oleivorans TaxID=3156618 RepID=UPI0032B5F5E0